MPSQADIILQALGNEQQLTSSMRQQIADLVEERTEHVDLIASLHAEIAALRARPGDPDDGSAPVPSKPRPPRGPRGGAVRLAESGQNEAATPLSQSRVVASAAGG